MLTGSSKTLPTSLAAGLPLTLAVGLSLYTVALPVAEDWSGFSVAMPTAEVLAVVAAFCAMGLGLLPAPHRRSFMVAALTAPLLLGLYLHVRTDLPQLANLGLIAVGFSCYAIPRSKIVWPVLVAVSGMLVAPLFLGSVAGLLYFALGVVGAAGLRLHNDLRNSRLEHALFAARQELVKRERVEAALRSEEERYRLVAHGTNDGWWDWDLETNQLYFSPRWKRMIGYADEEIGNDSDEWFGRVHADDVDALQDRIGFHVRRGSGTFRAEYRIQQKDGAYRWMACRGVTVPDETGKITRLAGSQTDITEHKRNEERLERQAFHDELTGLVNRAVFIERLAVALQRRREEREYRFAVLFLDLDRFKVINDSLGHLAGDQLLKLVASRLDTKLYPVNTVARLGGDEFAILIDGLKNAREAVEIADGLRQGFRRPFHLEGREIFITPSIGVAWGKPDYGRPEDLLRDSDTAMYQAKTSGRNCCELFQKRMHSNAVDLLHLENDLRRAVENREFCLHYQPIVSLKTYEIVGIEALLRWEHPEQGLLVPGEFLTVAEETGLILPVYWWVLREACRFMDELHNEIPRLPDLSVSVNLSGRQFTQSDLVDRVLNALRRTGLSPSKLCLEITENVLMNQSESARMLKELQSQGIQIHLDDFGTGYSSLGYLNRFSFDALKVDRSFIQSLEANGENMKIVRAMVDLAHNLSMTVVVEGLETIEQIETMKELKTDLGQGYYFAHPLSPHDVKELLQSEPRLAVFDYWKQTKTG